MNYSHRCVYKLTPNYPCANQPGFGLSVPVGQRSECSCTASKLTQLWWRCSWFCNLKLRSPARPLPAPCWIALGLSRAYSWNEQYSIKCSGGCRQSGFRQGLPPASSYPCFLWGTVVFSVLSSIFSCKICHHRKVSGQRTKGVYWNVSPKTQNFLHSSKHQFWECIHPSVLKEQGQGSLSLPMVKNPQLDYWDSSALSFGSWENMEKEIVISQLEYNSVRILKRGKDCMV